MNLSRIVQKLRRESPFLLTRKLLWRRWRKIRNRRRRNLWSRAAALDRLDRVHADTMVDAARQLWPGLADRSWLAQAPERWPQLHAEARALAVQAAEGKFNLLGSGWTDVSDGRGGLRWCEDFKSGARFPDRELYLDVPIVLSEGADIKVPWELSRFSHVFWFAWTDPESYGDVFQRQWLNWLAINPLARGVNWACTMDVAIRAISWTAAVACWGERWDESARRRMAAALANHGHFIRDNLEWSVSARTNHYFADIVGLAVLGTVLKGYPPARRWLRFAAGELRREIGEQFAPDGSNKECSTTYHRLMVELATLGWLACERGGEDLGCAAGQRLLATYRALAMLCGRDGRGPLVGDNDSSRLFPLAVREDGSFGWLLPIGARLCNADALAIGEAPPELAMLWGTTALDEHRKRSPNAVPTIGGQLADGGLFVLGDDHARMLIRCGPLAYQPVGGHQHLDQLSITLFVGGLEFIADPGQFCYTSWPAIRNSYRSTAAHSTVEVDGQPQCRVFTETSTMFSVVPEAEPKCVKFEHSLAGGCFVGRHSGYRRLNGGGDHIRQIRYDRAAQRWSIVDRLELSGQHQIVSRFLLHPSALLRSSGEEWRISRGELSVLLSCNGNVRPEVQIEESHFAPQYGRQIATRILAFSQRIEGPTELSFNARIVKS